MDQLFSQVILDVQYESLVQSPEEEVEANPGVHRASVESGLPEILRTSFRRRTFSRDQVRSAINTKSIGRWKNYAEHLSPLFDALAELGYSQDGKRA